MMYFRVLVLAAALAGLAACDLVRYPGDGGAEPETPDAPPDLPEGAPGPPPPVTPVDDPYDADNDGDVTEVDTPNEPGDLEAPDTETSPGGEDLTGDADDVVPDEDATDTGANDGDDVPTNLDDPETGAPGETTEPADQDSGDAPDEDPVDTDTGDTTPPSDADDGEPAEPVDGETPDADGDTDVETDVPPDVDPAPVEPAFSYHAPGRLLPGTGSGQEEQIVHAPDIVFPIADAPAYLQSMVFTFGGGVGGGDQCDTRNYAYPWRDNFCETRSRARVSPFCPTDRIHQGQDIRVGTPQDCNTLRRTAAADRALHKVVAVEDGVISHIGTYSVNLRSGGRIYKYMHMNMRALQVTKGQAVTAGQHLGFVSNDFGGTPTTFHLHFEITQNTAEHGWAHVPPYLSLVEAYERRENGPGEPIAASDVAVASAPIIIPEGFEIIE